MIPSEFEFEWDEEIPIEIKPYLQYDQLNLAHIDLIAEKVDLQRITLNRK